MELSDVREPRTEPCPAPRTRRVRRLADGRRASSRGRLGAASAPCSRPRAGRGALQPALAPCSRRVREGRGRRAPTGDGAAARAGREGAEAALAGGGVRRRQRRSGPGRAGGGDGGGVAGRQRGGGGGKSGGRAVKVKGGGGLFRLTGLSAPQEPTSAWSGR